MERYLPLQEWLLVFLAFGLMAWIGVKVICGWACPVGALQEFIYDFPILKGIKKKRVPFWVSNGVRIVLSLAFVIFAFGWIADFKGQSIYRYFNPFKLFEWKFREAAPIVVSLIFGLSLIQYRTYCMWICPSGAAKGINEGKTIQADCFSCARCLNVCPNGSMEYGWGNPGREKGG